MPEAVKRNTFRKPEKVCNQNQIDALFTQGKSLKSGFFRLIFIETEKSDKSPVQVLIAVPKKKLRHAVDRNRMKRLIREAYRLNKHKIAEVYSQTGTHCDLAVIFNGAKCVSQAEATAAIKELLDRLILTHEQNSE